MGRHLHQPSLSPETKLAILTCLFGEAKNGKTTTRTPTTTFRRFTKAQRSSVNILSGDWETKNISMTSKEYAKMLMTKVFPAIRATWPEKYWCSSGDSLVVSPCHKRPRLETRGS
ncbi:hypothetical protein PF007_g24622 [Phytophthora fragariae]|uniref:Uncharacterized protein n=1 Tax=Phytophthora fragariae TaxID=53985 RepID=A0A6A3QHI1_9STRA|nr:hypothetical protein PF007_g24622 [Phytophthora fragariae]